MPGRIPIHSAVPIPKRPNRFQKNEHPGLKCLRHLASILWDNHFRWSRNQRFLYMRGLQAFEDNLCSKCLAKLTLVDIPETGGHNKAWVCNCTKARPPEN